MEKLHIVMFSILVITASFTSLNYVYGVANITLTSAEYDANTGFLEATFSAEPKSVHLDMFTIHSRDGIDRVPLDHHDTAYNISTTDPQTITIHLGKLKYNVGTLDTLRLTIDEGAVFDDVLYGGDTNILVENYTMNVVGHDTTSTFKTTWITSTSNEVIHFTLTASGDYAVKWDSGVINYDDSYTYSTPGNHTIVIYGEGHGIDISANPEKLQTVDQWGDTQWLNMRNAFANASNMTITASDTPDFSRVTSMSNMFANATSFNQPVDHWDVSDVVYMSNMFANATSFNQPVNGWDMSNVTDATSMFQGAASFNQPVNGWDVSSMEFMHSMFQDATSFNQPVDNWDVSSVRTMGLIFHNATSFNQPLQGWDVSGVYDMYEMLSHATSFNQPLQGWNLSDDAHMYGLLFAVPAFDHPLGEWYIALNSTSIGADKVVGHITKKIDSLSLHPSIYTLVSGGDNDLFEINNSTNILRIKESPAKLSYTITINATGDNDGVWNYVYGTNNLKTFTIEPESIITINDITNKFVNFGETLGFTVTARDSRSAPLTYSLADSPPTGATINSNTGAFVWTPTINQLGIHTFSVDVNNNKGQSASKSVTVTVTNNETINPKVTSFERHDPLDEHTSSTTLVFRVTFSEDVVNVDASDFEVSSSSTASGTVTSVSQISPSIYNVTMSVTSDGILSLDMASDNNIVDRADIPNVLISTPPTTNESYTVDTISPTIVSFTRSDPIAEHTGSTVLVFRVTFDEGVSNVDASDFEVSSSSTASGTVDSVSNVSDSIYDVTTSVDGEGTFNLDMVSSGHNIVDKADTPNPLINTTPGSDESYIVDNTLPSILLFERYEPTHERTSNTEPVFRVTFSEAVVNVDASDFEVSSNSTALGTVTSVSQISPSIYNVTMSVTSDGILNLDMASGNNIVDKTDTSNRLTSITPLDEESYTIDTTSPTIVSFTKYNPVDGYTSNPSLVFRVTFDEGVSNVDRLDFEVSSSSTASGIVYRVYPISPSVYEVEVYVDGDGTFSLGIVSDHDIVDVTDIPNALTNTTPAVNESYTVDMTSPTVVSFTKFDPTDEFTSSEEITFRVTFSEPVTGVDSSDFEISSNSTGSGSITNVHGHNAFTYDVTVDVDGDGTFNLGIDSNNNIGDIADTPNLLTDTLSPIANESYTVDTTAPTVVSFERSNPTDEFTSSEEITFRVTFSEPVTGVDSSDFELSPSSTGTGHISHIAKSDDSVYSVIVDVTADGTFNLDIASSHNIGDKSTPPNLLDSTTPSGNDQSYTVDTTAPTVVSFERNDPLEEHTSHTDIVFTVIFSEPVTEVDSSDFVLSPSSTGNGTLGVDEVTDSQYHVTIYVTQSGTFNLDIASSHNIGDKSTPPNLLDSTTPSGNDQSYTVDTTAPTVVSFERSNPTGNLTSSQTLVFRTLFSEDVANANSSDFVVLSSSSSTGNVTDVSQINPSTYDVTVEVDGDGTFNLGIASRHSIGDKATPSNPLTDITQPATDESYTVDATPPTILSFERHTPMDSDTPSRELVFYVTFDEPVTGVNESDFVVSSNNTASGTVSNVSSLPDDSAYYVTVNVDGDGEFNLDMITSGHNIADTSVPSNRLSDTTPDIDESYVVDVTILDTVSPTILSIERHNPTKSPTSSTTLVFRVTFDEIVENVDILDFELSANNNVVSTISDVSPFTNFIYDVTASVGGDGTFHLVIVDDPNIQDSATTPNELVITRPSGSNESYIVDATIPVITSPVNGFITNSTSLAVNGTAKSTSTITLFDKGVTIATNVPTNSSGNWGLVTPLTEGVHKLTAVNTAGLSSNTVTVTIDRTNPIPNSVNYYAGIGKMIVDFSENLANSPNYEMFKIYDPENNAQLPLQNLIPSHDGDKITAILNSEQQEIYESFSDPHLKIAQQAVYDPAGNMLSGPYNSPISYIGQSGTNGNGGSGSSPVVDVNKAIDSHLLASIPSHIASVIDAIDESTVIAPIDDDPFDFPLAINGHGYLIDESLNTIQPQTIGFGESTEIAFTAYSRSNINHFVMFLNLDGDNTTYYESDTYVTYLNDRITVIDPHNYIANATITVTQDSEESFKYTILVVIEFDGEMGPTNMAVRIWNDNSRSTNLKIIDALDIVPSVRPLESTEEETTTDTVALASNNTDEILSNIKMWAGFDSQHISDSQLLAALGLDYPNVEIPDWIMTQLAVHVIQGNITVDEFVSALVFILDLLTN